MNHENFDILKQMIRTAESENHFDMSVFNSHAAGNPEKQPFHECGTICCMAGLAALWAESKTHCDYVEREVTYSMMTDPLEYMLGVCVDVAEELSMPPTNYLWKEITADQACQALDNVLEYGEPNWEDILQMNRENFAVLKRMIKSADTEHQFDMSTYASRAGSWRPNKGGPRPVHACGTVCCIAGLAYLWEHGNDHKAAFHEEGCIWLFLDSLAYMLDITPKVAKRLAVPPATYGLKDITADQAIAALDNVLETGEPLWETILENDDA